MMMSLDDVADTAAAGQVVRDYLAARGIRTTATLALLAKTEADLEKCLMLPLFGGWKTTSGTLLSVPPEEQPIVQAILLHMWSICRKDWTDSQVPAVAAPSATWSPSATTTSKATTTEDKVPKTLPAGIWSSLIKKYQEEQLHGVNRIFPQRELLGAEVTLARMHHELHNSRMFTPIALGEIVERRSFTASGDANPLSKNKRAQALTLEDSQLVYQEDQPSWTPRSVLATLDGLSSIKWAMILIQWGNEADVEQLFSWLTQRARSRPQKMEQFNLYFTAISWQLCMDLRGGTSFAESSESIMKDMDKFTEYMSRESTVKESPKKTPPPPNPGKGAKGLGKKGKSSDSYRSQPYRQTYFNKYSYNDSWSSRSEPWQYKENRPEPNKNEWKSSPNK